MSRVNDKNDNLIEHERPELIRLNKYIGESGYCSRREADKQIEAGNVTIDGVMSEVGQKVAFNQVVRVNGVVINKVEKLVYLALNKPRGITSTCEKSVESNIVDFVNHSERIYPIGRLDRDSEGLILLTNDGDIVNKILRAKYGHEKEYIVTVDKRIDDDFIQNMSNGVPILDTVTNECFVEKVGKCTFRIILTQGLNRQIRRMCEFYGFKVLKLKRMRIMNIKIGGLATGQWRNLSSKELIELNTMINKNM